MSASSVIFTFLTSARRFGFTYDSTDGTTSSFLHPETGSVAVSVRGEPLQRRISLEVRGTRINVGDGLELHIDIIERLARLGVSESAARCLVNAAVAVAEDAGGFVMKSKVLNASVEFTHATLGLVKIVVRRVGDQFLYMLHKGNDCVNVSGALSSDAEGKLKRIGLEVSVVKKLVAIALRELGEPPQPPTERLDRIGAAVEHGQGGAPQGVGAPPGGGDGGDSDPPQEGFLPGGEGCTRSIQLQQWLWRWLLRLRLWVRFVIELGLGLQVPIDQFVQLVSSRVPGKDASSLCFKTSLAKLCGLLVRIFNFFP